MNFVETPIDGAWLVNLSPIHDNRGYFARAWSDDDFVKLGLCSHFAAVNLSCCKIKGTIRGLHYQAPPYSEAKFVRCIRGALFDVIIDLRIHSPSYLKWSSFELTAESKQALYVPDGCAHGIQSLANNTEMLYMVSSPYQPNSENGIRWDDPYFAIQWPETHDVIVSNKDRSWPDFALSHALENQASAR